MGIEGARLSEESVRLRRVAEQACGASLLHEGGDAMLEGKGCCDVVLGDGRVKLPSVVEGGLRVSEAILVEQLCAGDVGVASCFSIVGESSC